MRNSNEFSDCLCFNLRRAARRITQTYDHALAPAGLKATQFSLLAVLAKQGKGIGITDLAEQLGMDRTTLTRNLAVVERKGLVQIMSGDDPRSKSVTLTPAGKTHLDTAAPLWRKAQFIASNALGSEIDNYLSHTRRIGSV